MKRFYFLQIKSTKSQTHQAGFRAFLMAALIFLCCNLFSQTEVVFEYTGAVQTWTVPSDVTSVHLNVSGAQGGDGFGSSGAMTEGGYGGIVNGNLAVTPGQVLYIYVGGEGQTVTSGTLSGGGWNGGGNSRGFTTNGRGGGGGASDVRVGGTSLNDRVIVGAGGGGGCLSPFAGGNGGGATGDKGTGGSSSAQGGTQSSGGSGTPVTTSCNSGEFGIGGSAGSNSTCGGGGGGWYGGGSGWPVRSR